MDREKILQRWKNKKKIPDIATKSHILTCNGSYAKVSIFHVVNSHPFLNSQISFAFVPQPQFSPTKKKKLKRERIPAGGISACASVFRTFFRGGKFSLLEKIGFRIINVRFYNWVFCNRRRRVSGFCEVFLANGSKGSPTDSKLYFVWFN